MIAPTCARRSYRAHLHEAAHTTAYAPPDLASPDTLAQMGNSINL